jgi:hypothetical protein
MQFGNRVHVLSPGVSDVVGNDEVPLLKPQYAANTACADEISAVCEEHEYLTEELIPWLTRSEFSGTHGK